MKKIISLLLFFAAALSTFSQQNNPVPALAKQDYLQKSKHQKTAAWVLLGGGIVLSSVGAITAIPKAGKDIGYAVLFLPNVLTGNPQPEPENNYTAQTILLVSGFTAMLSSIPLFIASGKNKRKAMSLSFKNQTLPHVQKNEMVYQAIPSISLKISL